MLPRTMSLTSGLILTLAICTALSSRTAVADEASELFKGPYLGLDGGYLTSSPTFESAPYTVDVLAETVPFPGRNDSFDLNGFQGGVHAGYNYVTQRNFLLGIEADLTYIGADDTSEMPVTQVISPGGEPFDISHRSKLELEWQSTIRLRTGYVADKTLFYGTAGIAFAGLDWKERTTLVDINGAGGTITRNHHDRDIAVGYAVGLGVEHAFTDRLTVGASYLYENFGDSISLPFGHSAPAQSGQLDDLDIHRLSLRLTYQFGNK